MYDDKVSVEHKQYIEKIKKLKIKIFVWQIGILLFCTALWQVSASLGWVDPFIVSSPLNIIKTLQSLFIQNMLWKHLFITIAETVAGFLFGTCIGTFIAMVLWWLPTASKICDPYLVVLNSLPKVALGPVIIVWAGSGINSIMIMTLAISLISTIIGVYGGFTQVDEEKIMLLKTFGATKRQILFKVILPASYDNILNALKINVGLSWVGVIMGEFLVSKAGVGYLIMYGSQVFNLNLVMTGVILLAIAAALMYLIITKLEKIIRKKFEYN